MPPSPQIVWLLAKFAGPTLAVVGAATFSPSLFWLVLGAGLCLLEVALPTAFVAFMMGVGAILVSLVAVLIPTQGGLQVLLWMVLSTAFVLLARRFLPKRKMSKSLDATEAKTLTEILPGETGRVLYEGNSWSALCEDDKIAIAPNQKVYVVRRQGTTLIVMPEHLLHS